MKVWIVTAGWNREETWILGVFATEQGAQAFVGTLPVDGRGMFDGYDFVRVHAYDVTL
jgi:hypothetical protein